MDDYIVVANDGKEYGPVDLPGLLGWIEQSRVLGVTLVRKNGADPVPAASLPELQAAFAPEPPAAVPPVTTAVSLPAEFSAWSFIGRAWELVKPHWLPLSAMFFLVTAIGAVPYIGGCVFLIVSGAIYVGINRALLGLLAGRPPDVGMMFQGFDRFGQALLATLVMSLLIALCAGLCLAPGLVATMATGGRTLPALALLVVGGTAAAVIGAVLTILWVFVYLVLAETNVGFWEAMEQSAELTAGYRWQVFGLLLACVLVGVIGLLACFVGLFVAYPVIYTAVALAYRFLQSKKASRQASAGPVEPATPTA